MPSEPPVDISWVSEPRRSLRPPLGGRFLALPSPVGVGRPLEDDVVPGVVVAGATDVGALVPSQLEGVARVHLTVFTIVVVSSCRWRNCRDEGRRTLFRKVE